MIWSKCSLYTSRNRQVSFPAVSLHFENSPHSKSFKGTAKKILIVGLTTGHWASQDAFRNGHYEDCQVSLAREAAFSSDSLFIENLHALSSS